MTNPSRLTQDPLHDGPGAPGSRRRRLPLRELHARPWTRDGQVRALIVNITPRVDGNIVKVHVADNQFVRKGDPLLEIDPSQYPLAVQAAEVNLQQQRQDVADARGGDPLRPGDRRGDHGLARGGQKESERARAAGNAVSAEYVDQRATAVEVAAAELSEAQAKLAEAKQTLGAPGEDNVRIQAAKVALDQAKLNLAWAKIIAPSDGFVTNLTIEEGDYARVGRPLLAFVDSTSFWVSGYFMETQLRHIKVGDPAVITLMAHPDQPLTARSRASAGRSRRRTSRRSTAWPGWCRRSSRPSTGCAWRSACRSG